MEKESSDNYSLKWGDYSSSFSSGFHALLEEEAMLDVTLAADNGQFLFAHKLVLSVCSPYFKHLFKVNPCKHPIVILKDVSLEALRYMLQFMYKGEVGVRPDEIPSFLNLAQILQIKGLSEETLKDGYLASTSSRTLLKVRRKKRLSEDKNSSFKMFPIKSERPRRKKRLKIGESLQGSNNSDNDNRSLDNLLNVENNRKVADSDDDHEIEPKDSPSDFEDEDSSVQFNEVNIREQGDCAPQGGVDYQMIQTKRGRDMLLYDGYTFTQNRMCKDGMRWQCSYPKCKAFCRMSSAGWLTPYNSAHPHSRPSEDEIRRRILRMELKARAQSSGATPGEIIRNALPAEEYQTTDQRACYTRCIQRFRKSLELKRSCAKTKRNDDQITEREEINENAKKESSEQSESGKPSLWINSDSIKNESATSANASWQTSTVDLDSLGSSHSLIAPNITQLVSLTEQERQTQMAEQQDNVHSKLGVYGV